MNDAASFDAILQCNLLEVFCEALGAAIFVTDKLDEISFASIRLLHLFPIRESAIAPGGRARDLYGALHDAGLRFGTGNPTPALGREEWIAERVACAWRERVDKIEQAGPDRWIRIVSRRFSSGLGFVVIQDVSEQKKKEELLRLEQERVKLTEEILDTLSVAVAVKDRNLDYVAVNQEFCRALGTTREALLGRRSWDALAPDLAGRLEQMDWHLLSTGEPSCASIIHTRPDGETVNLERRAVRLGKPGSPYIAVSLAGTTGRAAGSDPSEATPGAGLLQMTPHPVETPESFRNVLHLTHSTEPGQALKLALRAHGIDLCHIVDAKEFATFLPAARAAGIRIDLVVIDFEFDAAAFNIASAADIEFRMLAQSTGDSAIMAQILGALPPTAAVPSREAERSNRRAEVSHHDLAPRSRTDGADCALDILAVEDNALNRMVLDQMLGGLDLNVQIVPTAGEALAVCRARSPRIVLADMTLPDREIADLARDLRRLDPSRPLVAMVSANTTECHQHARSIGFDESLSKPLSAEALAALLGQRLALAEMPLSAAGHPSA
jgi:PAS domain S-box-containing protein